MPDEKTIDVVYVGAHDAVEVDRQVAVKGGDPVSVEEKVGKGLIARGDFEEVKTTRRRSGEKE